MKKMRLKTEVVIYSAMYSIFMDSQLKKGLIEYGVLASLAAGDSYGYQLLKNCPPDLGLTQSTLYPLLKRLELDGRVATYAQLHHGRTRNYYHLTALGRQSIRDFVEQWDQVQTVAGFIKRSLENDTQ